MTVRLVMATRNAHKLSEVQALLRGSAVEVVGLPDDVPEPPEDHDTFEKNALQKATFVQERLGGLVVADDSGIEVDALDGAPGVRSKRFTADGTDAANNAELLRRLGERTDRAARYRCALALVSPTAHWVVTGSCEGTIGLTSHGAGGFGYDPLFWPEDFPGRTMAELTMDEKNRISHRGRAFVQLPELVARALR